MEETTKNEEKNDKKSHIWGDCEHHGRYGKFFILRWILAIIILSMVFCLGVQVGKFKATIYEGYGFHKEYGHHMMDPYDYRDRFYNRGGYNRGGYMMMPNYYYGAPQNQTTQPQSSSSTTPTQQ